MAYDIRKVAYEYMMAEILRKEGDLDNAIKHYQSAIDNYEYADNEYLLDPDSPYTETVDGETVSYPSAKELAEKSYVKIWKLECRRGIRNFFRRLIRRS